MLRSGLLLLVLSLVACASTPPETISLKEFPEQGYIKDHETVITSGFLGFEKINPDKDAIYFFLFDDTDSENGTCIEKASSKRMVIFSNDFPNAIEHSGRYVTVKGRYHADAYEAILGTVPRNTGTVLAFSKGRMDRVSLISTTSDTCAVNSPWND